MEKNKGFTLVELLVAMAIFSMVIAAVTSVMVTGSQNFVKGNEDTQIQKEAQLAVNQIEDMIIDTNGGLDYAETEDYIELVFYNAASQAGVTAYTKESVKWVKADQKIMYSRWNVTYNTITKDYEVGSAVYEDMLLAENVSGFEADISDKQKIYAQDGSELETIRSVTITAAYISGTGKVSYATTPVITLRNRMLFGGTMKQIFDNTPVTEDTLKIYISDTDAAARVPVLDRVTTVERGLNYFLYAMINTENDVNALVNWTIEESDAQSTVSAEGLLSVGAAEPNQYLTVVATYKNHPEKYAKAVVRVEGGSGKSLDGVDIITVSLNPFSPNYDSYVTTTGFTEEERASDLRYVWTVSEPDMVNSFTDNASTLSLSVKQNSGTYGRNLRITLTVTSASLGTSVSDSVVYNIPRRGDTGDSYLERGKIGQQWYRYECTEMEINSWDYYFCDEEGNHIASLDYLKSCINITMYLSTFDVGISPNLPCDSEYWLMVEIDLRKPVYGIDGRPAYYEHTYYERIIHIPAVRLYGTETTIPWNTTYNPYSFDYRMIGYYPYTWTASPVPFTVEIEDMQYNAPDGVTVTGYVDQTVWVSDAANWVRTWLKFSVPSGYEARIEMKSVTVKVYVTEYPDVYCYCTINFTN